MKPINKETLKIAAHKLMFDMDEAEYDTLLKEFSTILNQMELIGQIPHVDDVEPMTFPYDITVSALREDEIEKPLDREEALRNASDVVDGQIRLPKVVG